MKVIFFLANFLLAIVSCHAQQAYIDTLIKKLESHAEEDSVRVGLLADLASAYSRIDPEKGIEKADEILGIAKKHENERYFMDGYMNKAANLRAQGAYNEALSIYQKALEISERNKFRSTGGVLMSIGLIYANMGNYTIALDYYLRALKFFDELPGRNHYGQSELLMNTGILYKNLSQFEKALHYHREALDLYTDNNDSGGMALIFGNIATTYSGMKDHEQALKYYNMALEINSRLNNNQGLTSNLGNIGSTYREMGDYARAHDMLQQALDISRRFNFRYNTRFLLLELGDIYENAPPHFLSLQGLSASAGKEKAAAYYAESFRMAEAMSHLPGMYRGAMELSEVYAKQGKYQQALEMYKRHIILRDSILGNEKRQEIAQKEMEFEFEKKEALTKAENDKKHALAAAEIKRQRMIRNTSIIGGIALIIVGGIIVMLYKVNRDADEQKREADFRSLVSETEMKALRAQMNPHFIFNSLNSINDYIARHDTDTATLYTTKFARLMRIVLENSEHREVSLADDLKALELYMQLEALRMGKKMQYSIVIDPEIDPEHTMVPPLLLQPFVENAIWHGLAHKKESGHITINIGQQDGMLYCSVQDNGIGRKQSEVINAGKAAPGKKSLGMKITGERIQIINRVKNAQAEVRFEDLEEGTQVLVKLPLEKSN